MALLYELIYTLSRTKADSLAAPYAPVFEDLCIDWTKAQQEEVQLWRDLSQSQAHIDTCAVHLDKFSLRVAGVVSALTGGSRKHSLYVRFYGDKTIAKFNRPVLGVQLEAMRRWGTALGNSDHPDLKALTEELGVLIDKVDKAIQRKRSAQQLITDFRLVGSRKKLFQKANAARKRVHGELAELSHKVEGLPLDFADQFFRHEETDADREGETIEELQESIAELEKKLGEEKQRLTELQDKKKVEATQATKREAQKAEIAALRKAAADAEKKALALQAELEAK